MPMEQHHSSWNHCHPSTDHSLTRTKLTNFVSICYSIPNLLITINQWEFHDPKMEVLYHKRPYFVGIFPWMSLLINPAGWWFGTFYIFP
jgi:hypothetical protein